MSLSMTETAPPGADMANPAPETIGAGTGWQRLFTGTLIIVLGLVAGLVVGFIVALMTGLAGPIC